MSNRKLSDLIFLSDVDGTLLPAGGEIPSRNIEAVRRFTQKGGRFGIATGRSKPWVEELTRQLPVNAPCVLYNGGMLYDFAREECIMEKILPDSARDCMQEITSRIPGITALVVTDGEYFNVHDEMAMAGALGADKKDVKSGKNGWQEAKSSLPSQIDWRKITGPWYKILFLVQREDYQGFFDFVGQQGYPGVRFVGTNPTLIEMLPEGSSKGTALEELLRLREIPRENLIAIGDFYNDQEMIEMAGLGITLQTAPADLQAKAGLVVGTCEGGALADAIEYLEAHFAE